MCITIQLWSQMTLSLCVKSNCVESVHLSCRSLNFTFHPSRIAVNHPPAKSQTSCSLIEIHDVLATAFNQPIVPRFFLNLQHQSHPPQAACIPSIVPHRNFDHSASHFTMQLQSATHRIHTPLPAQRPQLQQLDRRLQFHPGPGI